MVSRTETARALLTPGEIMQLPPDDEIVMVAGVHPIRARKVRYYGDRRLASRIQDPPAALAVAAPRANDWTSLAVPIREDAALAAAGDDSDPANGGIRREPELPEEQEIVSSPAAPVGEFEFDDNAGDDAAAAKRLQDRMRGNARQAALDPGDGIEM